MKALCACLLIILAGGLSFKALAANYKIQLDSKKGLIKVNACFDANRPVYLSSGKRGSDRYLVDTSTASFRLSQNGRRMYLKQDCIDYQVDLNLAKQERQARHRAQTWLVNNRAWFWRPVEQQPLSLSFFNEQSRPTEVSVPWPKQGNTFISGNTPLGWTSRMLFGDIEIQTLDVGGKSLHVAQTMNVPDAKRAQINDWLTEAANSVVSLYGHFPVDQVQILVIPIGKRREAIPWAEVQRAGRPAIHFFIDPSRPISEFKDDWTAVHELSHLLTPRIDYNDRWLSEGLASYYQYVAKARAGLLTSDQAWQKLRAGFARGRRVQSGHLRDSKSTRHLYWGGAAIYMLADMRLRELPKPQTLDQVLATLYQCCLPNNELWSASEFMATLDKLSETKIFSQLLANEAMARRFPIALADESRSDSQISRHIDDIFQTNIDLTKTND